MKISLFLFPLLLVGVVTPTFATSGTPEQLVACRPDVRRFCHHIHESDGDDAYLACLKAHRPQLSVKCRTMLESNGV